MRIRGIETNVNKDVPTASNKRKRPVSPLKKIDDKLDQNKALRPKAAIGKAVAVPRCSGKFEAAV